MRLKNKHPILKINIIINLLIWIECNLPTGERTAHCGNGQQSF